MGAAACTASGAVSNAGDNCEDTMESAGPNARVEEPKPAKNSADVVSRLYGKAINPAAREQKLEAARNELMAAAGCTFRPSISSSRGSRSSREQHEGPTQPVQERLYQRALESRRRSEERTAAGWMVGCTFKPDCRLTNDAVPLKRTGQSTVERLYNPGHVRERNDPERNDPSKSQAAGFDFTPKINKGVRSAVARVCRSRGEGNKPPSTAELESATGGDAAAHYSHEHAPSASTSGTVHAASRSSRSDSSQSVFATSTSTLAFERLFAESEKRKAHLAALKAKRAEEELQGVTFTPNTAASKLSSASRVIVIASAAAPAEEAGSRPTSADPFTRLYQKGMEMRERLKEKQGAPPQADPECKFAPDINPTSRKIAEQQFGIGGAGGGQDAGAGARHIALYEQGVQKVSERAKGDHNRAHEPHENELAECTFRPAVNHITTAAAAGASATRSNSSTDDNHRDDSLGVMAAHDRLYAHAMYKKDILDAAALETSTAASEKSFASSLRQSFTAADAERSMGSQRWSKSPRSDDVKVATSTAAVEGVPAAAALAVAGAGEDSLGNPAGSTGILMEEASTPSSH